MNNWIHSVYDVFFKNIILYIKPIEKKYIFNTNDFTIKKIKSKKSKEDKLFIFKINKVEYNKLHLYNYGYCYHVSNKYYKSSESLDIAYPPDNIEEIILTMSNNDKSILTIDESQIFIPHILLFCTNQTKLYVILYYYLQKYLKNFDTFYSVKIKINDKLYNVDHYDSLYNIYNHLESVID